MYIGFTGAGGVGKTSTAEEVARMRRMPMIPSVSRGILKKYFANEGEQRGALPSVTYACQSEISEAKLVQDESHYQTGGICDRTPMDQLAYLIYRCPEMMQEHALIEDWLIRCAEGLKRYTRIFYFPLVTYPTQEDGLRETSYAYRYTYDALLQQIMKDVVIAPNVVTMPRVGSISFRANWVNAILDHIETSGS